MTQDGSSPDADTPESAKVVIVNEAFVRKFLGATSIRQLGRPLASGSQPTNVTADHRSSKDSQALQLARCAVANLLYAATAGCGAECRFPSTSGTKQAPEDAGGTVHRAVARGYRFEAGSRLAAQSMKTPRSIPRSRPSGCSHFWRAVSGIVAGFTHCHWIVRSTGATPLHSEPA